MLGDEVLDLIMVDNVIPWRSLFSDLSCIFGRFGGKQVRVFAFSGEVEDACVDVVSIFTAVLEAFFCFACPLDVRVVILNIEESFVARSDWSRVCNEAVEMMSFIDGQLV